MKQQVMKYVNIDKGTFRRAMIWRYGKDVIDEFEKSMHNYLPDMSLFEVCDKIQRDIEIKNNAGYGI